MYAPEVQIQKHIPKWTKTNMQGLPQWPGTCRSHVGKGFLTEAHLAGSTVGMGGCEGP